VNARIAWPSPVAPVELDAAWLPIQQTLAPDPRSNILITKGVGQTNFVRDWVQYDCLTLAVPLDGASAWLAQNDALENWLSAPI
jgi:hypothetical protein